MDRLFIIKVKFSIKKGLRIQKIKPCFRRSLYLINELFSHFDDRVDPKLAEQVREFMKKAASVIPFVELLAVV